MSREVTLSTTTGSAPSASGALWLYDVLTAGEPLVPARSSRHLLAELDEVELTRAPARQAQRSGRRLSLGFPDARLSAPHALLTRSQAGWLIEDRGSKNGLFVNGARAARTLLAGGDVIEAGYTFLVLRLSALADAPAPGKTGFESLDPDLLHQLAELERAARSVITVLIGGESGTGKEVLARAVHSLSARSGPLIAVNCAALPKTLLESELFGFKKGSFSGALADKPGLVAASHGGTLFLDEIAELTPEAQAALLRVLQEREVLPIGAVRAQAVDLRLVAATHRDLAAMAANGEFRADLLARLGGFRARLPPLRERRQDLGLLLAALMQRLAPQRPALRLSHSSARLLFSHPWRGNVRELERALEVALALAADDQRPLALRPEPALETAGPAPLRKTDEELRTRLEALLREHHGNVTAVARALGKAREQVHRWIKRCGLDPDSFRE